MEKIKVIPHQDLVDKFLPSVSQFGTRRPVPIDAALDGNVLTICFEDGRKLAFDTKTQPVAVKTAEEEVIAKAEGEIEAAQARIQAVNKENKATAAQKQTREQARGDNLAEGRNSKLIKS